MHQHHSDLLTHLLLHHPPTVRHVAPNLASRLRLLSLPPTPPSAPDLPRRPLPASSASSPQHHHTFIQEPQQDDDGDHQHEQHAAARLRLAQWLVTDLYPSPTSTSTVERLAHAFFHLRRHLLQMQSPHQAISDDFIQATRYAEADTNQIRLRLDLRRPHSQENVEALSIFLVQPHPDDPAASTHSHPMYENMLPTALIPDDAAWSLHLPPLRRAYTASATPQEDQENPAEYIGDPDDFWAGFSDDEQGADDAASKRPENGPPSGTTANQKGEMEEDDDDDDYWASYGGRDGGSSGIDRQRQTVQVGENDQVRALKAENVVLRGKLAAALKEMKRIREQASAVVASLETTLIDGATER